jgi:hypothetical protein
MQGLLVFIQLRSLYFYSVLQLPSRLNPVKPEADAEMQPDAGNIFFVLRIMS